MMTLREWAKSDISEIARLEKECFSKGAWTEQMIEQSFNQGSFYSLLVETNGKICAYLGATLTKWEGDILLVATSPECRRKGYAKSLLTAFINYARVNGLEKIFLEVRESNFKAISLYQKMGFSEYSKRKNYYENTEDCINMVYVLKE